MNGEKNQRRLEANLNRSGRNFLPGVKGLDEARLEK
jgi:hypothetical protein